MIALDGVASGKSKYITASAAERFLSSSDAGVNAARNRAVLIPISTSAAAKVQMSHLPRFADRRSRSITCTIWISSFII